MPLLAIKEAPAWLPPLSDAFLHYHRFLRVKARSFSLHQVFEMDIQEPYACTRTSCDEQKFDTLGEVIEHLRGAHKTWFIHRSRRLGERDGHRTSVAVLQV